jgi:hypothetical protein
MVLIFESVDGAENRTLIQSKIDSAFILVQKYCRETNNLIGPLGDSLLAGKVVCGTYKKISGNSKNWFSQFYSWGQRTPHSFYIFLEEGSKKYLETILTESKLGKSRTIVGGQDFVLKNSVTIISLLLFKSIIEKYSYPISRINDPEILKLRNNHLLAYIQYIKQNKLKGCDEYIINDMESQVKK